MSMPPIPGPALAEVQLFAKKAFKHAARELERKWFAWWGKGLEEEFSARDEDYGDAYSFAAWAARQVLALHGFPDIDDKYAFVYWDGERVEFEEY